MMVKESREVFMIEGPLKLLGNSRDDGEEVLARNTYRNACN